MRETIVAAQKQVPEKLKEMLAQLKDERDQDKINKQ